MNETMLNGGTWKLLLAASLSALFTGLGTITYFSTTTISREEVRILILAERQEADRTILANQAQIQMMAERLTDLRILVGQIQVQIGQVEAQLEDLENPKQGGNAP